VSCPIRHDTTEQTHIRSFGFLKSHSGDLKLLRDEVVRVPSHLFTTYGPGYSLFRLPMAFCSTGMMLLDILGCNCFYRNKSFTVYFAPSSFRNKSCLARVHSTSVVHVRPTSSLEGHGNKIIVQSVVIFGVARPRRSSHKKISNSFVQYLVDTKQRYSNSIPHTSFIV
jgi:hypothetical protein